MQRALRHFHQPSSLSVVFVIAVVLLLAASIAVVMGVTQLLSIDRQGAADPRRLLDRLF